MFVLMVKRKFHIPTNLNTSIQSNTRKKMKQMINTASKVWSKITLRLCVSKEKSMNGSFWLIFGSWWKQKTADQMKFTQWVNLRERRGGGGGCKFCLDHFANNTIFVAVYLRWGKRILSVRYILQQLDTEIWATSRLLYSSRSQKINEGVGKSP